MKNWKMAVAGLMLFLLAGAGYSWYLYNKAPSDVRQQAAEMDLKAVDLLTAFKQDEVAAGRKYVDKIITVSGKVAGIQIDTAGQATLFLDAGDPLSAVTCSFYASETTAVKNISPGSTVQVKGICTGILIDVVLNKCSMMK